MELKQLSALANKVLFRNRPKGKRTTSNSTPVLYSTLITSADEEWRAMMKAAPRAIEDRIHYYGYINDVLQRERREALIRFQNVTSLTEANFEWEECPGALILAFRVRGMFTVLYYCREIPDYPLVELIGYLGTMSVTQRRDYANGMAELLFYRSEWPALYGGEKAFAKSHLARWTNDDWADFQTWKEDQERNRSKALEEEGRARFLEQSGPGARRPRLRVASTDTDVVRVMEAMKAAGIIDPKTKQRDIAEAFTWQGRVNERPDNYAATKSRLMFPPSAEIIVMIGELLTHAGEDIWKELETKYRPKPGRAY